MMSCIVWALAIALWTAIVWWSLQQIVAVSFVCANAKLPIPSAQSNLHWISSIECFHMTSRGQYCCRKTMKRRPLLCPEPILWELNTFVMQMLSFVPINLHKCWSREWKRSIWLVVSRWSMTAQMNVVLNRTVVNSDWRFDNLCDMVKKMTTYATDCWIVSHCQQQSYSRLRSPGRSSSTYLWNDSRVSNRHSHNQ